jgi:uncharacterized protein YjbI with pentapeptide repeats
MEDVPLKDYFRGERYSADEVRQLRERWSKEDTSAIAEWLESGADQADRPDCLIVLRDSPEAWQYDLRGIDLGLRLGKPRSENTPQICLPECRLEYAKLHYCNLQYADLVLAHLTGASLAAAGLQHASLRYAHIEEAELSSAHLDGAQMDRVRLQGASVEDAHLDGAVLTEAQLQGASFARASLRNANLRRAYLEDTNFRDVIVADDPRLFEGFDVRGIRYSDPLFDQFVRQSEFIRRCKETWPKWMFEVWEATCDCGRSFWRLAKMCGITICFFALLYMAFPIVQPTTNDAALRASLEANPITYLYFSVVTFSTLGFGDVTPCNCGGQIVVMLEVLLGYVALGALISVFSMKILLPR